MNGILYALSAALRWANAGGGYVYDGTFSADSNVGGYPKGARVLRSDGLGYWLNTADNNTNDPEGATPTGWVPDLTNGVAAVTMTNANVTLTPLRYGKPIIVISGTLTANLNLIFPAIAGKWAVINNTTGNYTITCKTSGGTGVIVNGTQIIIGDGTNIYFAVSTDQTAIIVRTTDYTTSASSPSKILWSSAVQDPLSLWDAANNQFVIKKPGIYDVRSAIHITPGSAVVAYYHALINGSTTTNNSKSFSGGTYNVLSVLNFSARMRLNAGDTLAMYVFGESIPITTFGDQNHCWFELTYTGEQ